MSEDADGNTGHGVADWRTLCHNLLNLEVGNEACSHYSQLLTLFPSQKGIENEKSVINVTMNATPTFKSNEYVTITP
jgi:hypothetical protein